MIRLGLKAHSNFLQKSKLHLLAIPHEGLREGVSLWRWAFAQRVRRTQPRWVRRSLSCVLGIFHKAFSAFQRKNRQLLLATDSLVSIQCITLLMLTKNKLFSDRASVANNSILPDSATVGNQQTEKQKLTSPKVIASGLISGSTGGATW